MNAETSENPPKPPIMELEELLNLADDQRREFWWRYNNDLLFRRISDLATHYRTAAIQCETRNPSHE